MHPTRMLIVLLSVEGGVSEEMSHHFCLLIKVLRHDICLCDIDCSANTGIDVRVLVSSRIHCTTLFGGITVVTLAQDTHPHRYLHHFPPVLGDSVVRSNKSHLRAIRRRRYHSQR